MKILAWGKAAIVSFEISIKFQKQGKKDCMSLHSNEHPTR